MTAIQMIIAGTQNEGISLHCMKVKERLHGASCWAAECRVAVVGEWRKKIGSFLPVYTSTAAVL